MNFMSSTNRTTDKRAHWYCPADDAFLCQACNGSVHSANSLANRHERVRLKTSSLKNEFNSENSVPSWVRGFTRKARTPRGPRKPKSKELTLNSHSLVTELGCGESSNEENEEQLLYRVPVFDSIKLCTSTNEAETRVVVPSQEKDMLQEFGHGGSSFGFLPFEMELEEFVADVESLLGKGLDKESGRVKVEDDDEEDKEDYITNHDYAEREPFELNFDYDTPVTCQEEGESQVGARERIAEEDREGEGGDVKFKKVLLRLDYKGVITAWADQRSPWKGDRPEVDPSECWPHCMGSCGTILHPYGDIMRGIGGHSGMVDSGREARVSRYREKRRTRLFSKKIRYEVRKLNAEKRPRMKGRFVKKASFAGPSSAFPLPAK
ncbi:B-box type zinc finger protein with CCT domain-containing protein [Actinidia rufa]|uniref:B-box type zinc finger protein with CCT domain-containing protein n=1 Tax=Actinidia rufa TaxID=165716 RepID=A0A7J0DY05_9ERIC|nr:B-box type zinc finger protein with CCT domain-containing protein [Actinidia rufa]